MIKVICAICSKPLKELGALLFSPPTNGKVIKFHICVCCYKKLFNNPNNYVWHNKIIEQAIKETARVVLDKVECKLDICRLDISQLRKEAE